MYVCVCVLFAVHTHMRTLFASNVCGEMVMSKFSPRAFVSEGFGKIGGLQVSHSTCLGRWECRHLPAFVWLRGHRGDGGLQVSHSTFVGRCVCELSRHRAQLTLSRATQRWRRLGFKRQPACLGKCRSDITLHRARLRFHRLGPRWHPAQLYEHFHNKKGAVRF